MSKGPIGREPTPPPNWPNIYLVLRLAEAVAVWLHEHEGAQRRPDVTARILVLVVLFHRIGQPWPTRHQVKNYLGASLPMIDSTLSSRQATGHLSVELLTFEGKIKRRPSIITLKYLVPCPELIAVVAKAEKPG